MATTYRIAVIGSWESVMGFRALGLETYPVTARGPGHHPGAGRAATAASPFDGAALARPAGRAGPVRKDELRPAIILIPAGGLSRHRYDNIQQSIQSGGADIL